MVNKEKAAKQLLSDTNERILKLQAVAKSAQKNATLVANILKRKKAARAAIGGTTATARRQVEAADLERASTRVKDVIAALKRAADSRREHMNEKKSNNSVSSTWVQSFPGMPNALKKSLWHRMHRRKQQIVLRPTEETMLNELRAKVLESVASAPYQQGRTAASRNKRENAEEELLKAEQMFLLAMHPYPREQLPTVPLSKSGENTWAEPGWHLVLDVPDTDEQQDPSRILPCRPKFPVLEKNLSEIASAPGRQAASLLRTSHFRCLSSPLSAFAVASSPAETGASMPSSSEYIYYGMQELHSCRRYVPGSSEKLTFSCLFIALFLICVRSCFRGRPTSRDQGSNVNWLFIHHKARDCEAHSESPKGGTQRCCGGCCCGGGHCLHFNYYDE